jgi:hypothetical protein
MRKDLMLKIVKKSTGETGEVWCISKHLLAASMRLMEVGTKALSAGKKSDAADLFGKAYELYSLFWGINMGLVDLSGVKKNYGIDKNLREWIGEKANAADKDLPPPANSDAAPTKKSGLLSGLGEWVKKSVNCCIE